MTFSDLNARNHEVTMLMIKHIRLREKYGEGEVLHEEKQVADQSCLPIPLIFS
jgi:hypothetical protein